MSTLMFQRVLVETDDHFDSVKKEEEEEKGNQPFGKKL